MAANPRNGRWNRAVLAATGVALLIVIILSIWTASHRRQTQTLTERAAQTNSSVSPADGIHATTQSAAPRLSTQRVLKYGGLDGQLGMVRGNEQPPVGPESFAVGKDGGILIADVVNQRVVLYSSDGVFRRSLNLPGTALGDVAVDGQGQIYAYDQVRRTLQQYATDGTLRSTLNLKAADIDTRGYFHVSGNAIYFADAALRDVLVGTLQDGLLAAPDPAMQSRTEGIHGESGRMYSVAMAKGEALQLEIADPAAPSAPVSIHVPLQGIVSARFAGEDQARRCYLQTERLAENRIVLEVLAFSPSGQLFSAVRMPENDYAIWTAKLVDVQSDGTIVQFLPQQEQAKLNLFTN